MSPAIVEIKDVTKSFGPMQAVRNVSMNIEEGEFFSLLGPSGCGKTTLLRMIAGFEFPSTGEVLIGGKDMSRTPPHKRPVNMVFQSYALFPHLSIYDNIAFGLRMSKACAESQIKERVERALELVRLPHIISRLPKELSGGQQQRVAFARAIVNQPKVLLLDEPLSALDPKIRHEMQAELARFKKELGMTFVMVTHDQSEAFALSDRIAVLSQGHLEQLASPEELFESPKTPFVADFIGETNLAEAEVLEVQLPFVKVATKGGFTLWTSAGDGAAQQLQPGQTVTVWIRTSSFEFVESSEQEAGPDNNVFPAEILHRSFQGNFCDYRLRLSEDVCWTASLNNNGSVHHAGESRFLKFPAKAAQVIPHSPRSSSS
ncbi:MAG: ABC transporter ATP-binding protein [Candidatus Obscuribacterales bacterium]|nr:ABC transporter ATP-binding protein [Candidatus Obscuribacterales bacterium]